MSNVSPVYSVHGFGSPTAFLCRQLTALHDVEPPLLDHQLEFWIMLLFVIGSLDMFRTCKNEPKLTSRGIKLAFFDLLGQCMDLLSEAKQVDNGRS